MPPQQNAFSDMYPARQRCAWQLCLASLFYVLPVSPCLHVCLLCLSVCTSLIYLLRRSARRFLALPHFSMFAYVARGVLLLFPAKLNFSSRMHMTPCLLPCLFISSRSLSFSCPYLTAHLSLIVNCVPAPLHECTGMCFCNMIESLLQSHRLMELVLRRASRSQG